MDTTNFVARLNDLARKHEWTLTYEDIRRPDETFASRIVLNDIAYTGEGETKKEAKKTAAKNALESIHGESAAGSADSALSTVPPSPLQPTGMTQPNFMCWFNDYLQKNKLSFKIVESSKVELAQFVVEDKVYPVAYGTTMKEAKEEAAKLVYCEMSCSKTQESTDSMLDELNEGVDHSFSEISLNMTFEDEGFSEKQNIQSQSRFLSEYDSIALLGKGGFGSVFKAKQKLADKFFAIKIIPYKEKALREVRALSKLSHANIVGYNTCWLEDTALQWDSSTESYSSSLTSSSNPSEKYLYIKMELCDTETLRGWIDEKNKIIPNAKKSCRDPRRREDGLKIAQQLVSGVEYIHSETLIHRDLKPTNVLFGHDKKVKIGDFGLVTEESNDEGNVIERTDFKGTPSYMAPEQRQSRTYDRKVDIFALGLIYLELLWRIGTGQERQAVWNELRVQKLPKGFTRHFLQESLIIESMLSEQPHDRPEANKVMLELQKCAQAIENNVHSV